jgi:1-acyl-sn-glycerol-3-phosphate acyltransferase
MWLKYTLICPFIYWMAKRRKNNLRYTGSENVPRYGPFIVVSNHQTTLDYFVVGLAMRRTLMRRKMVPWAKVEIAEGQEGFLGRFLWHYLGTIPIERRKAGELKKAIRLSLDYLGKGEIVYVFPEGTRSPRGELGSFKFGVSNLARLSPVPILPVAVYRREEDNGMQVNIGKPFVMPGKKRLEAVEPVKESVESVLRDQIDAVERLSANLPGDKEGMKMITSLVHSITANVSHPEVDFDEFCRMSDMEDNRFIQDKVFDLLPEGWSKAS